VVEGLPEEEADDPAPVSVGDEVAVAAPVGIVVGTPVVGIERAPVAPGIFTAGRGDCKRTEKASVTMPCTLSLPCVCKSPERRYPKKGG